MTAVFIVVTLRLARFGRDRLAHLADQLRRAFCGFQCIAATGTVKLLSSRQQNARCRRQPRSCRPGDTSHLSPGGECLITGGMKRGGDGCVIEFVACQTPPVAPFRYFTDDNLTVPFSAMAARYSLGIPDTYRTASGLNSDFQGSNPRRRANPTDLPTKAYFRNIAQRVSRPCKRANPRVWLQLSGFALCSVAHLVAGNPCLRAALGGEIEHALSRSVVTDDVNIPSRAVRMR